MVSRSRRDQYARRSRAGPGRRRAGGPRRERARVDAARARRARRSRTSAAPRSKIGADEYRTTFFQAEEPDRTTVTVRLLTRRSEAASSDVTVADRGSGHRVPGARVRVRRDRQPHAVLGDPAAPVRRPAPRSRRLHGPGPRRGQRRVRRPGQGVQQDGVAVGGPARGAPEGAQPPAGRHPPRGRVVRARPGPRRRAGDRRADRGRRRRRRLRARHDAPPRRGADGGGRHDRRSRPLPPRPARRGGGRDGRRPGRGDQPRRLVRARGAA